MKTSIQTRPGIATLAILAVLLLSLLLSTTACGSASLSSAKLLGHDSITFEKAMESYFDSMMNDEVSGISHGWAEGWQGSSLNAGILTSNEKPVTYIVTVNLNYMGEVETNRLLFFLVHNTKTNMLSVQGGLMDEDGETYSMSMSDARSMLSEAYQ